jgi:hypothetical protein
MDLCSIYSLDHVWLRGPFWVLVRGPNNEYWIPFAVLVSLTPSKLLVASFRSSIEILDQGVHSLIIDGCVLAHVV